ncbi:endolytic transglycosylase MltG [Polluticoccus soli]|uniref:endolytic transglycosylase MltG n=1 Tax=Polluticoccus soli TaxID=3034150 RepID=UPI0023E13CDD|nr:endolytic transglycosylase MltG [Flavipsychrobacter sp. JY13-12]
MASKKGRFRWIGLLILVLFVVGAIALWGVFGPNTGDMKGDYLYIHTGSTYADVQKALQEGGFVRNMTSFDQVAKRSGYPEKVKAGKYKINKGMSNYNMVRRLRNGDQEPVKLVINKLRTKQDLMRLVSKNLEADSLEFRALLNDNGFLSQYGLDSNTSMAAVIPDTYEFWWNTDAKKTFAKLAKYYKQYWNDERKQKAAAKNLKPEQVVTLASIVEEETNKNDEKGNIASVYMNRMKIGMRLQADPTIKFAVQDFTLRRIGGVHMQNPSPYNTYRYAGLPPGPICTPSKKTLEAVLNAPDTKYIYFCAKEDFSGYHRFAASYAEHQKNASLYQKALNARGIH